MVFSRLVSRPVVRAVRRGVSFSVRPAGRGAGSAPFSVARRICRFLLIRLAFLLFIFFVFFIVFIFYVAPPVLSISGATSYFVSFVRIASRQAGRDAYIRMMGSRIGFGLLHRLKYSMELGHIIPCRSGSARYPQSGFRPVASSSLSSRHPILCGASYRPARRQARRHGWRCLGDGR